MIVPKLIGKQNWGTKPGTRKFVISGCGRSGTLYMTKVFDILGFKVGHEEFLKNGCSSWYLSEKTHASYIKDTLASHNVIYIHIVRNPLDVITSMWQCEHLKNRTALDFVREHYPKFIPGYDLESVVKWWMFWNMQTISNLPITVTLPVEQLQFPDALYAFCEKVRINYSPKRFQRIKEIGTKTHTIRGIFKDSLRKEFGKEFLQPITLDIIREECGDNMADLLKEFAKNYGYML